MSPTRSVIGLLFRSASHCAFIHADGRPCPQPLIEWEQGYPTKAVDVAHIRSASPDGPRHDPDYTDTDSFDNLLLACQKHHRMIDYPKRGEVVYPIELCDEWKRRQVAQPGLPPEVLSTSAMAEITRQVEAKLQALTVPDFEVELLGGFTVEGQFMIPTRLESEGATRMELADSERYLGVHVVNRGLAGATIATVGIEFAVSDQQLPPYSYELFPMALQLPDTVRYQGGARVLSKASRTWWSLPGARHLAHCALVQQEQHGRPPTLIRAAAFLESTDPITPGPWIPLEPVLRHLMTPVEPLERQEFTLPLHTS